MANRLSYESKIDCSDIFTEDFIDLLIHLHDKFNQEVKSLRKVRLQNLKKARNGEMPEILPTSEANSNWMVEEIPEELRTPGIEISGPASITSMLINALNPGPGGVRAEGDLDDDEDAAGHTLEDSILAIKKDQDFRYIK